jgi:hypothetical protein
MPWPQILTPDIGKQIMKDYQFGGIPFIILLDKKGKIIAKSLRGVALEKTIEKELNK